MGRTSLKATSSSQVEAAKIAQNLLVVTSKYGFTNGLLNYFNKINWKWYFHAHYFKRLMLKALPIALFDCAIENRILLLSSQVQKIDCKKILQNAESSQYSSFGKFQHDHKLMHPKDTVIIPWTVEESMRPLNICSFLDAFAMFLEM